MRRATGVLLRHGPWLAVCVIGLAITIAVGVRSTDAARDEANSVMDRQALFVAEAARISAGSAIDTVRATAGLFLASDRVDSDEFDSFVAAVGLDPGMAGLAYVPTVTRSEWDQFLATARSENPGFALHRIDRRGERTLYEADYTRYPVLYAVSGSETDPVLVGFDATTDRGWLAALNSAENNEHLVVSPLVRLFGVPRWDGFLVVAPVIADGAVTGHVVGVVALDELVETEVAASLSEVVSWQIRDVTEAAASSPPTDPLQRLVDVNVGSRIWQVDVVPTETARESLERSGAASAVAVGMLLTGSAAVGAHLGMRAARARREAQEMRWLAEEKDEFMAALSHELRTPLTVVVGMADLLDEATDGADPEVREYVGLLRQESGELARLVEDLLLLGRLDADVLPMKPTVLDLEWEVGRVLADLPPPEHLHVEVAGSATAWADPLRLRHVIRHLVSNAYRHARQQIEISLHAGSREALLRVVDDGDGVPPRLVSSLFTSATGFKETPGGPASLGLGLRVSSRLAAALGGRLTYRRDSSRSVFELHLPGGTVRTTLSDAGMLSRGRQDERGVR